MTAHDRRKTPGVKGTKRPAARANEAAEQKREPTPEMFAQYWQEVAPVEKAMEAAFVSRLTTPAAWQAWVSAVHQRYEVLRKHQLLWALHQPVSQEDLDYGWDFWRDIELLRGGDATQAERAVAFLEADPWFHSSGYTKATVIRYLKPPILTPEYKKRLRPVVLNVVDTRDDRDFRIFCRLARKVDAPALREQLTARLTSSNADIRRRARWVLEALAQKDNQEKGSEQNSQQEKQR